MTNERHTLKSLHCCLPALLAIVVLASTACSSIDCPIKNRVYTAYAVVGTELEADTLKDSLTIYTHRLDQRDTVLFNRGYDVTAFELPVSYNSPEDTLYFHQWNGTFDCTDTVRIAKTNTPHFESVECAATFFHHVTGVVTTHHGIDTIIINNANINYDASKKHFHIRFKTRH